MRRLFDLLAILLLLVLASAVFLLFSFKPDNYKQDILTWLNQHSDWQLDYHSSMWSLYKPLSLEINDFHLSKGEQGVASAERAEVSLSLLPLLSKELEIASVKLERAKFLLEPSLLESEAAPAEPRDASAKPSQFQLESIVVKQLLVQSADLAWQQAGNNYRLERFDLAIEDWQVMGEQGFDPFFWQLQFHTNAQALQTPYLELALPQLSFAWAQGNLVIDHISADLFQGSVYAAAEYTQQQLRIQELALNNLRIDELSWLEDLVPTQSPELGNPLVQNEGEDQVEDKTTWLKQLSIERLLVNQLSLAGQWQQQSVVVNNFTGELENFDSAWPLDQAQASAKLAFIADELNYQHFLFANITADAQLDQGIAHIAALRGDVFKGEMSLSLSYDLAQQALNIHQLELRDNELPIQEHWLAEPAEDAAEQVQALPLQYLNVEQLKLRNVKLLSYLDQLPFSALGLTVEMDDVALIHQGQWQSLEQLWEPQARLFIEAPELAYQGLVIKQFSVDMGAEESLGYFNFYGELPLGQLELQGEAVLDQQGKPWQAELSGLLLDVSPLARLADNREFNLQGDLELHGKLRGQLHQLAGSIDGFVDLQSQLLRLPQNDLNLALQLIISRPEQHFVLPHPLVMPGPSSMWQQPSSLPKGSSQLSNTSMKLVFSPGEMLIEQQKLAGLSYPLLLEGALNLNERRFDHLSLVVTEQECWRLAYLWNGDWSEPEYSVAHYALSNEVSKSAPANPIHCRRPR